MESSTPSISENSERDFDPSLNAPLGPNSFNQDTIAKQKQFNGLPTGSTGKDEPRDDSASITFEDHPSEADPSETESISSRSSEMSTVSAPIRGNTSQSSLLGVPALSSHKASHIIPSPSTTPKPLHASANNIANSGNIHNNTKNESITDDSIASANAPFPLDNAFISTSSPELTITKANNYTGGASNRSELSGKASLGNGSNGHQPHSHASKLSQSTDLCDESDGLVGISDDDDDSLITGETERPHEVHTLHPMQVRSMPKWFLICMIICISMIGFGSYAAYDAVAAVQDEIMKDMKLTTPQFSWLYSIYSLPNIFLVILGGKMVDKYGAHYIGVLTTSAIAIGAGIVAFAPSLTFLGDKGRFFVMLGGRFIFGAGAETSYVVQNSMCVKWFFGDHLAVAMAFAAVGTRLGSIGSFVIAPHLVGLKSYTFALWIATGTCIVSVLAVIGYIFLRSYAKKHLLADQFDVNSLETDVEASSRNSPRPSIDVSAPHSDLDAIELQSMDDNGAVEEYTEDDGGLTTLTSGSGWKYEIKLFLHQLTGFNALFWGSAVLGVLTYGITLGFRAVAGDTMASRYNLSSERANLVMASLDITGLIASPIVGWLIDYTFKIGHATLVGNFFSVLAFLLLLGKKTLLPGVISLGLSSSIVVAAIYPAISFLAPPSIEGLAFGLTSSAISAGNLIINFLIAQTLNQGWIPMVGLLIGLSVLSVAITVWWIIRDAKSVPRVLNRPRPWTNEIRVLRRCFPFINF